VSDRKEQEEQQANRIFKLLLIGIVAAVVFYATLLFVVTWPISSYSMSSAGTFGDSFGILTSIFSGVAFAGLIWTILLQRAELRLQRKELTESRRQSILTRLMTVTQNQISSYRSEIASLQFENIVSPGDHIGTGEMIFTMIAYLESLTQKHENGEVEGDEMVDYLHCVIESIRSYQALIQGLNRCCKSNRMLLINESITADEANDLKSHMLSELPTGLMCFILHLHSALNAYNKIAISAPKRSMNLYDPLKRMEENCNQILNHESHQFTDENMELDKKQKWLFQ
jgi:uncharacterized membrane protein